MKELSTLFNSIQGDLFPALEEEIGELTQKQRKLVRAIEVIRPDKYIMPANFGMRGRPSKSRLKIFNAFLAKSVYNLSDTRSLLTLLESSPSLRRLCGWENAGSIPSESTFSRAFGEFASTELTVTIQDCFIEENLSEVTLKQISYDSSAISAREKPSSEAQTKMAALDKQFTNTLDDNLSKLPQDCNWGAKKGASGKTKYWKGYKLHLAVTDGDLPVAALLSSASLHDSQLAIPLMQMSSKFEHSCDLMDSAYDANEIRFYSRHNKVIPIIDHNKRRGEKNEFSHAEKHIYRKRSCVERVFSNLKDNFGCRKIMVKGSQKVMTHIMFGLLALSVDQMHNLLV